MRARLTVVDVGREAQSAPTNPEIAHVPVAVLAGGLGKRLRPYTETIPKALVELDGRPFIDYQLDLLHRHGIRRAVMCVGYLGRQIEQHLGNGSTHGMQIAYSYDGERPIGSGGALRRALSKLGELFWVVYGDSYMDIDYRAVLGSFRTSTAVGLMTVIKNRNRWDRSNVVFRDGKLLRYDKRIQSPEMLHIDYGVSLLRHEAAAMSPLGQRYDVADLYRRLAADGRMVGYEVSQRFYEIGTPRALGEATAYLKSLKLGSKLTTN